MKKILKIIKVIIAIIILTLIFAVATLIYKGYNVYKTGTTTTTSKTTIVNKSGIETDTISDIKDVLGVGNISSSVSSSSTVDVKIVIGKDYK